MDNLVIVMRKDRSTIKDLKSDLNKESEIKDLEELKYFLNIQVQGNRT